MQRTNMKVCQMISDSILTFGTCLVRFVLVYNFLLSVFICELWKKKGNGMGFLKLKNLYNIKCNIFIISNCMVWDIRYSHCSVTIITMHLQTFLIFEDRNKDPLPVSHTPAVGNHHPVCGLHERYSPRYLFEWNHTV